MTYIILHSPLSLLFWWFVGQKLSIKWKLEQGYNISLENIRKHCETYFRKKISIAFHLARVQILDELMLMTHFCTIFWFNIVPTGLWKEDFIPELCITNKERDFKSSSCTWKLTEPNLPNRIISSSSCSTSWLNSEEWRSDATGKCHFSLGFVLRSQVKTDCTTL